jgi:ADP-ribosyl-[dinitrogen reductase] hydrolase
MTHIDPRALFAASGIADIVALSLEKKLGWLDMSKAFKAATIRHSKPEDAEYVAELTSMLNALDSAHIEGKDVTAALSGIDCSNGIDGYAYRSALGAAYIAAHATSTSEAIIQAVTVGGDTDSTAALAAALHRAGEKAAMPIKTDGIVDWPVNNEYLMRHARNLNSSSKCTIAEPNYPLQLLRNIGVVILAMGHVVRRWLPPYR